MIAREKGRVLLVEHDLPTLHAYGSQLSKAGFAVTEVAEASEALLHLKNDQFDVLINDVKLPETNGLDFLRRVRIFSPNLQLVFMLETADNRFALEASELGGLQSLIKPIKPEILERAATLAVRLKRKREKAAAVGLPSVHRSVSVSFTATEAKNEFGRLLEKAILGDVVVITRHDAPKAVLISIEEFNALSDAPEARINALSGEFDALLARMQQPASSSAMQVAFRASPEQLGKAAVEAAGKRG
ncbi:MAG: type II toxin-antitoxin system prevent-host-death family antitoxin [Candidatus Sulfotelmatobacter sp.]|jgi:prevent-host-death family protein